MRELKPPFPWFGGKSRAASIVWRRFGNVPNYIEPFFGSGAVLFLRHTRPKTETVNDLDGYVCNFWRSVQADPEAVARHADWPVMALDLTARNAWLIERRAEFTQQLSAAPDYYDAKVAGWWVWGQCAWIGSGWGCDKSNKRPHLGDAGQGVHRLPHLGDAGQGVHRLPHLGNAGQGVHRLPHLGNAGQGENHLTEYMQKISDRLRFVRICSGEWDGVLGPSVTVKHGVTGVFLDPPYSAEAGRENNLYAIESTTVAHRVREWAIANGNNPLLRIALCGYDGEHDLPKGWEAVEWKANGGYSNQGNGNENKHRETIWFSPYCLKPDESLFVEAETEAIEQGLLI